MTPFLNIVQRLLTWTMALSVAVLLVPVTLQIVARFTDIIPRYIWTEELSRFCFIWMVMLGAIVAVRERLHFDVDVWTRLTPRQDTLLRMAANFCVLAFSGVMIWWGIEFTKFGWNQTSELADLPMWMIFIAWPFAGVIWLLFLIEAFVRDIDLYQRGETLASIAPQEAV